MTSSNEEVNRSWSHSMLDHHHQHHHLQDLAVSPALNSLRMTFHLPTTTNLPPPHHHQLKDHLRIPVLPAGECFDASCPAECNMSSVSGSEEHSSETRPTPNYSIKFHVAFCPCCHSVKPVLD